MILFLWTNLFFNLHCNRLLVFQIKVHIYYIEFRFENFQKEVHDERFYSEKKFNQ